MLTCSFFQQLAFLHPFSNGSSSMACTIDASVARAGGWSRDRAVHCVSFPFAAGCKERCSGIPTCCFLGSSVFVRIPDFIDDPDSEI